MKNSRLKDNIILGLILLNVATGYYIYKEELKKQACVQEHAKLDVVKKVLDLNPKLNDSFNHFRKLKFLQLGGQYVPNYENPRTLNDKVIYYYENYFLKSPILPIIGTKYLAKQYTKDIVGEDHVVKLYGTWNNPEDIEWDKLPSQFVLKSVRGNFGREVIVVKDKASMNVAAITEKLHRFCSSPIMQSIKNHRIIAEELLQPNGDLLIDYKFFCSFGKVLVADCMARQNNEITDVKFKSCSYYEIPEWKRIPIYIDKFPSLTINKPRHFDKMIEVCQKLSKAFPLVRIDLYEIGDRVLVGEITEDSSGGKTIFDKVEWDFRLGDQIPTISKEEIAKLIERDREIAKKYPN